MTDQHTEDYAWYAATLRTAGYEVVVGDVVVGRLEKGNLVREVVLDRGGRLSLTVTRSPVPGRGKRLTRGRWKFRTLLEQQQIARVACELAEPGELAEALAEAERLAGTLAHELDEQD